jgi:hypothetical protein
MLQRRVTESLLPLTLCLDRGRQPTHGCGPLSSCGQYKKGRVGARELKCLCCSQTPLQSEFDPITKAQERWEASTTVYAVTAPESPACAGSGAIPPRRADAPADLLPLHRQEPLRRIHRHVELFVQALR